MHGNLQKKNDRKAKPEGNGMERFTEIVGQACAKGVREGRKDEPERADKFEQFWFFDDDL
jgi:hypothetical protein